MESLWEYQGDSSWEVVPLGLDRPHESEYFCNRIFFFTRIGLQFPRIQWIHSPKPYLFDTALLVIFWIQLICEFLWTVETRILFFVISFSRFVSSGPYLIDFSLLDIIILSQHSDDKNTMLFETRSILLVWTRIRKSWKKAASIATHVSAGFMLKSPKQCSIYVVWSC